MQRFLKMPALKPGWGVPASAAAHLFLLLILIFGLPLPQFESREPEAIAVELVPEPPQEEETQEEEQPAEEAPEETPEEPPPPQQPAEAEQSEAPPIQVLQPVFRFGEEDTGPEIAEDGNAPEEPAPEETAEEPAPEDAAPGIAVPAEKPPLELAQARTLFSHAVSQNPVAMNAMGAMTRAERGSELCATELREQLRNAEPPWRPDLLPAYKLGEGTVIEVREGAFHASGQWFDLSFRCEVDSDALLVMSFAFSVGDAIPRDQWRARGFPAF